MKNIKSLVIIVIIIVLASYPLPASADNAKDYLILPDLISFSDGIGSVYETGQESGDSIITYSYQCRTDSVESVVQEYIRELRKYGIFISQSEKTVYDSTTNDANYGVALRDTYPDRAKFAFNDLSHEWSFKDVSVYISFSTGGPYEYQYINISCAEGSYRIEDTGAKMQTDRRFSPADYYFYRDQLETDAQKTAYDYILSKVEKMETPISLEGLPTHMDYDEFFLVWYSVLIDNPQIFTVDDPMIGEFTYFGDGGVRSFSIYYFEKRYNLHVMKKAYEQAITEALTVIDPYMTDYQKELALHDWLCKHVRYDYSIGEKTTSSYSAIVKGLAVCEGYSEAFTELLHRAGIDAATVYGYILPEENYSNNSHAWNIVCIDGNWYYVDVTWDDVSRNHEYFNVTTEKMTLDHQSAIGTFPLCNSMDAAYVK